MITVESERERLVGKYWQCDCEGVHLVTAVDNQYGDSGIWAHFDSGGLDDTVESYRFQVEFTNEESVP